MKSDFKQCCRYVLCLLVVVALSSCVTKEYKEVPRPDTVITRIVDINALESDCGGLLIYYDSLTHLNKSELEKEKEILEKNRKESNNHCIELRYVLYSLAPETGMKNITEVDALVSDLLLEKTEMQRDERQLLELLADQLDLIGREREKSKSAETRLEKVNSLLDAEKEKASLLERQLGEVELKLKMLKNIDEKINAKEQEITTPSATENRP